MNKVEVFFSKLSKKEHNRLMRCYLGIMPEQMSARLLRFHRWEDTQASLLGKLILLYALNENSVYESFNKILLSANGKPYFVESDNFFNISHSDQLVVCALSYCEIGIDIERNVPVNYTDLMHYFSLPEINAINAAADKTLAFYQIWTKKEAVLKALGSGLSISLNTFSVVEQKIFIADREFFFSEVYLDDKYVCSIATAEKVSQIQVTYIDVCNL